jgi:hypothetical protein
MSWASCEYPRWSSAARMTDPSFQGQRRSTACVETRSAHSTSRVHAACSLLWAVCCAHWDGWTVTSRGLTSTRIAPGCPRLEPRPLALQKDVGDGVVGCWLLVVGAPNPPRLLYKTAEQPGIGVVVDRDIHGKCLQSCSWDIKAPFAPSASQSGSAQLHWVILRRLIDTVSKSRAWRSLSNCHIKDTQPRRLLPSIGNLTSSHGWSHRCSLASHSLSSRPQPIASSEQSPNGFAMHRHPPFPVWDVNFKET